VKENNKQDNTSSKAIANQHLQKKSNALSIEPPGSLSADTALAPPVQMNMDEAAAKYVAKRKAEKAAASAAAVEAAKQKKLGVINSHKGDKTKVKKAEEKETAEAGGEGSEREQSITEGAESVAAGFEFGSGMNEGIEDINQKLDPNSLTSENLEWDENTKRSDDEQEAWATKHGHSKEDVAKMKQENAETGAITDSMGLALSFFNVPGMYRKIKAPDNYAKFEAGLDAASMAANIAKTGSSIASGAAAGTNDAASSSADISKYTGGIIDLVKKGYTNFKAFKEEYENYQLIKNNSKNDASVVDGAKVVLNGSLEMAKSILEAIKSYQSTFSTFQNPAVTAAIPGLGIAISAISLFERIFTLYTSGKLEMGGKAEEKQRDSILSQLPEDQRAVAKEKIALPAFRKFIVDRAAAHQQKRDNKEIFEQYELAIASKDLKLQKRLKKRFPSNYEKVKVIHEITSKNVAVAAKEQCEVVLPEEVLSKIIDDQTIIDHLEEIKGKRETNAKIGIFTDLVNIGADIATLTGVGAAAGVGMKLGTTAIAASRSGGNALKFGARDSGAADFKAGAQDKWHNSGSATADRTNILKNREAKKERYFSTSKLIIDDIIEHETKNINAVTEADKKKVEASKDWIETKIMGTGASLTLTKAKLNSEEPEHSVIKYLMDCLKKR